MQRSLCGNVLISVDFSFSFREWLLCEGFSFIFLLIIYSFIFVSLGLVNKNVGVGNASVSSCNALSSLNK